MDRTAARYRPQETLGDHCHGERHREVRRRQDKKPEDGAPARRGPVSRFQDGCEIEDREGQARRDAEEAFYREVRLLPGTPTLERYRSQKLIALRDFEVEVEMDHGADDSGVLVAHGDQGGGYSLYVEDGLLTFAYNEYGVMHRCDGGTLAPGEHEILLRARAGERFTWNFELLVDGAVAGSLDGAEMLIGFAPFQGIDVGIDRRSPVVWSVFEQHGPFPYTGRLTAVTYRPGPPAPYDPNRLVELMRSAGRQGQ